MLRAQSDNTLCHIERVDSGLWVGISSLPHFEIGSTGCGTRFLGGDAVGLGRVERLAAWLPAVRTWHGVCCWLDAHGRAGRLTRAPLRWALAADRSHSHSHSHSHAHHKHHPHFDDPQYSLPVINDPIHLCELATQLFLTTPGVPIDVLRREIAPKLYHIEGYEHRVNTREMGMDKLLSQMARFRQRFSVRPRSFPPLSSSSPSSS